jgi:ribokinase
MGEKGALVLTDDTVAEVPGVAVEVVDTTGAGDAFNSGLAIALAEGRDLIQAVQYANCAGAITCTKLGVIPAMPDREAVDRLYAETFA